MSISNEDQGGIKQDTQAIVVGYGKNGRVKCVPVAQIGTPFQEKSIECSILGSVTEGPNRGFGKSPPHSLKQGQMVKLSREGAQEWRVAGTYPNSPANDAENDSRQPMSHPPGLWKLVQRVSTDPGSIPTAYRDELSGVLGGATTFQDMNVLQALEMRNELNAASRRMRLTTGDPLKKNEGTVRSVLQGGLEKGRYAAVSKFLPETVGGISTQLGNISNPTAFLQQHLGNKGEQIPKAFDMINSLKSAAKSGIPVSAADAIGGLGNWQNALAGIAALLSNKQGGSRGNNTPEDYLCILFKQLFPDFECYINDIETPQFRQWRIEYLKELEERAEEAVS